jgi:TetR/AcrR family transcriptional regulator
MERKDSIIITARKHFSRYGYSKTTMEEIARECAITKPTLYNHFASKADLFRAVIDAEQNACYALIDKSIEGISSAAEKLSIYADMQIQSLKKFLLIGELSRQAFLDLHPDVVKVYNVYRAKEEKFLRRWIEEGIRSREFERTNASHAARVYYLTIAALKYDVLVLDNSNDQEIKAEEIIIGTLSRELKQFVNLFLNGLKRRNSST